MPVPLSNLAAYSAQVACLAIGGSLAVALLRIHNPRTRYGIYRLLLLLCLALPWLQGRAPVIATPARTVSTAAVVLDAPSGLSEEETGPRFSAVGIAAFVLAGGMVTRLLWLTFGLLRLHRLRTAGAAAQPDGVHRELAADLGIPAEIRVLEDLTQPVTFGIREPVVLLPASLREHPPEIQRAVLYHELLHVKRRDWAWLLAEEAVRTVLWFHPAIWWLVSRVQVSREEVVDDLVVRATGERRTYVKALLAFSDETPLAAAPAFARRRDLFRRMERISKETVMSTKRIVMSCAMVALLAGGGSWLAMDSFPLVETALAQTGASGPGSLEAQAKAITPENPIPRRTARVMPEYPGSALSAGIDAIVTVRATLDGYGRIAEARAVSGTAVNPAAPVPTAVAAFQATAVAAVRQWQYDPPSDAPIAFPVSFRFLPNGSVVELVAPTADPSAPAMPAWHAGALRPGTGILPPKKIKDVRPVFPQAAKDANVQGIVILEVRIEGDGRVSNHRVMRSIPQLDQAAVDAVRQWEFQPTLMNGVPTPVIMMITVNFTLS